MQQLAPSPSQPHIDPILYGLVSLWDMINFRFSDAFWALKLLRTQIDSSGQSGMNNPVSAGDIKLTTNALDRTEAACKKIGFDGPLSPIMRARLDLTYPDLMNRDLVRIVSTVRESFADEIRRQYFFHYPCSKVGSLLRVHDDWVGVLARFKSCTDDVTHGVDCWVSGHHTASVFHMMRVAEVGLRVVAKERKVTTVKKNAPLSHGQWGDIIDEIEKATKREVCT